MPGGIQIERFLGGVPCTRPAGDVVRGLIALSGLGVMTRDASPKPSAGSPVIIELHT